MVQTRASASSDRVYSSAIPRRQRKLKDIMDKPRKTRKRKSAGPRRPPLRQETMTQIGFVFKMDENGNEIVDDENETAEEEEEEVPRRRQQTSRKRRKTLGDSLSADQSTLTQIGFISSDSFLDEQDEEADDEVEEHVRRKSLIPIWEDETAEPNTDARRKRLRRIRSIPDSSDDEAHADTEEVGVGGNENEEGPKDDAELGLGSEHEDNLELEDKAEGRNLRGTARHKKPSTAHELEKVADSDEEPDVDENFEENHSENDQNPKVNQSKGSPEHGLDSEHENDLESENEFDERNRRETRGNKHNKVWSEEGIADSDDEPDLDGEPDINEAIEESHSDTINQTAIDSSPPSVYPSHPRQVQIRSSVEPKTPRKIRYEIPDSDAESEDVSPEKMTPLKLKSPNSTLIQDTPSRRMSRFSEPIDLTTPIKSKPVPVPPSQATTVDHTQYLSSQSVSTQKTPVRKSPSLEAVKKSPFVLRSSQLLTESQMLPHSLMDSMPMPPRWVDSDEENEGSSDDDDGEL